MSYARPYLTSCNPDPSFSIGAFLPRASATGLAPPAVRAWTFALDPALFKSSGHGALTHDAFLADVSTSLSHSLLAGGELRAVRHTLSLRSLPPRAKREYRLGESDLFDTALVIDMLEEPLAGSRYTLELTGVDCRERIMQANRILGNQSAGEGGAPTIKRYRAIITTLESPGAVGAEGEVRPRFGRLTRPVLTWELMSAGREPRELSGSQASMLGIFPLSRGSRRSPRASYESWTVRGRVHFPASATPWLPALLFDIPEAAGGVVLRTANLSAAYGGWLDVEMYAPCTDVGGFVAYSWAGDAGTSDMRWGASLQGRGRGHGTSPGWHYIALRIRGAGEAAEEADLVVPFEGRRLAVVDLGCRSALLHAGPLLATASHALPRLVGAGFEALGRDGKALLALAVLWLCTYAVPFLCRPSRAGVVRQALPPVPRACGCPYTSPCLGCRGRRIRAWFGRRRGGSDHAGDTGDPAKGSM